MGLLESFELYFTGDGVWVDSYGKFCCDYHDQSGFAVVVDGGSIYTTPIIKKEIFLAKLLMLGNSVDVCVSKGENICNVDHMGNIWLMQLRGDCNINNLTYIGYGADMVAVHCNERCMYIAVLQECLVRLGKFSKGEMLGWSSIDYDRVRAINWIKQSNEHMLTLNFGDRRNIVLRSLSCIDTPTAINVYATASCQ